MWLDELLAGHPERFREQFGMSKHTFQQLSRKLQLYSGLTNRRHVTADEQLATFLYIARTGSSTRILQERHQQNRIFVKVEKSGKTKNLATKRTNLYRSTLATG